MSRPVSHLVSRARSFPAQKDLGTHAGTRRSIAWRVALLTLIFRAGKLKYGITYILCSNYGFCEKAG
jgi:hypothetical protein